MRWKHTMDSKVIKSNVHSNCASVYTTVSILYKSKTCVIHWCQCVVLCPWYHAAPDLMIWVFSNEDTGKQSLAVSPRGSRTRKQWGLISHCVENALMNQFWWVALKLSKPLIICGTNNQKATPSLYWWLMGVEISYILTRTTLSDYM